LTDIHGMATPEDRLMKAIWGKPELMYDRRQSEPRRTSWRGGRRATDWPPEFSRADKATTARLKKQPKLFM
jgi:hypothetical protein